MLISMYLKEKMRIYLFLILAVFFGSIAWGQKPTVILDGKVTDPAKKSIPGVTVTLKKNGATVSSVSTGSNGKYPTFKIPMGDNYSVVMSKDGYISKEVKLDFKSGYFEEDWPEALPMELTLELMLKKPDVDYSAISDGFILGAMVIDPVAGGLAPDKKFSDAQKKKYDDFIKEIDNKANAEDQKYKDLVIAADKAVAEKKYDIAVAKYQEAEKIKTDPLIVAKITDAQKKAADLKSYTEKMAEAKKAYDAKDYGFAKKLYEEAAVSSANRTGTKN